MRCTTSAFRSSALVGMHPQFKHTPPGRSSSIAATDNPSCAQRMAETYPPGPVPTTTTSKVFAIAGLDQQAEGFFEQPLDVLQEARAHRAIHHAVVAGERQHHAAADTKTVIGHDGDRAHGAHREDGAL